MVFKLIRIDNDKSSKIQLLTGKHIIGRGKLRIDGCDKRVSRNHAELTVTDNFIALKSLHHNPCFYIKKDKDCREILDQFSTALLRTGDKFGLVVDNFWYEVVDCPFSESTEDSTDENNIQNQEGSNDKTQTGEQNEAKQTLSSTEEESIDFAFNDDTELSNRSASPSLLNEAAADPAQSSPNKRGADSSSASPVSAKRIKTEPTTPDQQAGPSNDQDMQCDSEDQKPNIAAPAPPVQPAAPLRERCMYGANCYRRNPQHKAQFSHPTDSDWGNGDRGVCPYGHSCRKVDPRHWQQNEHPPGVNPPLPNARRPGQVRKKQRKQKERESDDDDDSQDASGSDLIVTGKRARKVVQTYTWGDSQSDGEEDPYGTDESDEWQPSSEKTNSEDFSQNF